MKHWILAAKAGDRDSLKQGFINVFMAKDEYASTLRAAYQQRQDEMKSDERDKAADYRALTEHYN